MRTLGVAFVCSAFLVAAGVAAVRAGSCRVLVALGSMQVEPTVSGAIVRLGGTWEFDNLLQVASGLSFNVLLTRDDNFVRVQYPDTAYAGYFPGLSTYVDEGLDGSKIVGIEAAGAVDPTAHFVSLESQRMKLAVPIPAGTGPLNAIAYLVIDGDYVSPIISNTLSRSLKEPEGNPAKRDDFGAAQ
ncbi:MAG TPA: hypothetical protein VEC57_09825 [Candidatus Limnocylindrales bacterium]|nr:hypothetical protein [Candidatus Limnocylindrales bacterium]